MIKYILFFMLLIPNFCFCKVDLDSLIKLDGFSLAVSEIRKVFLHDFEKFENMFDSSKYANIHKKLISEFDSIKISDDYKKFFKKRIDNETLKKQWKHLNSKKWKEIVDPDNKEMSDDEKKNVFTICS